MSMTPVTELRCSRESGNTATFARRHRVPEFALTTEPFCNVSLNMGATDRMQSQ